MAKRGCEPRSSKRTECPSFRRTIDMIDPPKPAPNTTKSYRSGMAAGRTADRGLGTLCQVHPVDPFAPRGQAFFALRESVQIPGIRKDASARERQAEFLRRFQIAKRWLLCQTKLNELFDRTISRPQGNETDHVRARIKGKFHRTAKPVTLLVPRKERRMNQKKCAYLDA